MVGVADGDGEMFRRVRGGLWQGGFRAIVVGGDESRCFGGARRGLGESVVLVVLPSEEMRDLTLARVRPTNVRDLVV